MFEESMTQLQSTIAWQELSREGILELICNWYGAQEKITGALSR